jgi:regulator of protease activity HflC (stomatin/prohibitin superfamily)
MKKILLTVAVATAIATLSGCSNVNVGEVGIKVHLLGGDKGVDSEQLGPGRYWIGMNEQLYTFPTFMQNYTWTKTRAEGRAEDESITFQTKEGLSVNADIGITYTLQPDKIPLLFQKYRKGITEITDIYLRNLVRDAINTESSTKPIESVYGEGKAELIKAAEVRVRTEIEQYGIHLDHLSWVGNIRLPETVTNAIDAKISASQVAITRQNEIETAKAEAQKAIAIAEGEANARLLVAEAEAKAIRLKGEAVKNNPGVAELNAIEKWNGVLPVTMLPNSSVPMIGIK